MDGFVNLLFYKGTKQLSQEYCMIFRFVSFLFTRVQSYTKSAEKKRLALYASYFVMIQSIYYRITTI